jgi:hypothetical protein
VALKKDKSATPPSTDWVFESAYINLQDPTQFDNTIYCPPMSGPQKVQLQIGNTLVSNPCQRPMLLYRRLVQRFSTDGGVVAEFTGGSGTLAATCATFDDLRARSGEPSSSLPCRPVRIRRMRSSHPTL